MFFIRKLNMSKKNVPKKTSNKIFIIFFLAILAVVTLTGFIYYQSQRPNFRDLEAAFNELNIPSDWQQVSESSNRGTWGLFCWQLEGEACPYKTVVYSRKDLRNYEELQDYIAKTKKWLESEGYSTSKIDNQYCSDDLFNNDDYLCAIAGQKNSQIINVTLRSTDANQKSGSFLSLVLSKSE